MNALHHGTASKVYSIVSRTANAKKRCERSGQDCGARGAGGCRRGGIAFYVHVMAYKLLSIKRSDEIAFMAWKMTSRKETDGKP